MKKFLPPLWLISCAIFLILCYFAYQLSDLLRLCLIAFIISFVINPVINWLEKLNIRRPFAIGLVGVVFVIILLVILSTAVPVISQDFNLLVENFPSYVSSAKQKLDLLANNYPKLKLNLVVNKLANFTEVLIGRIFPYLTSFIASGYSLGLTLVNIALLPFMIYYLLIDFNKLKEGIIKIFNKDYRYAIDKTLTETSFYINSFVRGQLIICVVLFILYAISLKTINLQMWLLLALISGFGHLIPYMGFIVGISLSTIISLVQYSNFSDLMVVWTIYAVIQFIEGSFLSPKIIGDKTGLNPLLVILGLVAGGTLFGLLGIVLAIPFLTTIKVIYNNYDILFGDKNDTSCEKTD